jgi:NAD(P)-dependent dehydrogenase (short-subunit alcohol dehydrogenase family)
VALIALRWIPFGAFVGVVVVPAFLYAMLAETTKPLRLEGKTVLVTGASSGLGKALAIESARRGAAKIILVARTETALVAVAKEVETAGKGNTKSVVLPVDVSDFAALRPALVKVLAEHDGVDLLINNAGAGAWKHTEETTPEEAAQMMAVPYQAAFAVTHLLLPSLRARKGNVLNVTSAASLLAFRGAVGYATARAAMKGFSRNLQHDVRLPRRVVLYVTRQTAMLL